MMRLHGITPFLTFISLSSMLVNILSHQVPNQQLICPQDHTLNSKGVEVLFLPNSSGTTSSKWTIKGMWNVLDSCYL